MRSVSFILAFQVAVLLALPPRWCEIIAAQPVECCPGCAEDDCDDEPAGDCHCQCGTTPFKQAEALALPPLPVAFGVPLDSERPPNDFFSRPASPVRDLQQLLCSWQN